MPCTVPANHLPFHTQAAVPVLTGPSISPALPDTMRGPLPTEITHVPAGQRLDVPMDGLVHILHGDPGAQNLAWTSHHCPKGAAIEGPALVAVDTAASVARAGYAPLTPWRIGVRHFIGQALVPSALAAGVSVLPLLYGLRPTSPPVHQAGASDLAEGLALYSHKMESMAKMCALWAGVMAVLLVVVVAMHALRLLTRQGYGTDPLRLIFPGAWASHLSTAPDSLTQHPAPTDMDPKIPAAVAVPAHRTPTTRLLAERAVRGAAGDAPYGMDPIVVVEAGERLDIPPNSLVSFWDPESGARVSQPHWHHIHCLSRATLVGPATVALRPGPKPTLGAFLNQAREAGGSDLAQVGFLLLLLQGFFAVFIAMSFIVGKPLTSNPFSYVVLVGMAIMGVLAIRRAYRPRLVDLAFGR